MSIKPVEKSVQRDSEGYELDENGQRIYPPWAAYVPGGAKTQGSARPPWVSQSANYWDESKPPPGFVKHAGGWVDLNDPETADEHPDLVAQLRTAKTEIAAGTVAPESSGGIRCHVCDRPFPSAAALKGHMAHHKRTDQHHADAEGSESK